MIVAGSWFPRPFVVDPKVEVDRGWEVLFWEVIGQLPGNGHPEGETAGRSGAVLLVAWNFKPSSFTVRGPSNSYSVGKLCSFTSIHPLPWLDHGGHGVGLAPHHCPSNDFQGRSKRDTEVPS